MRRFLSVILMIFLTFSILAGCKDGKNSSGDGSGAGVADNPNKLAVCMDLINHPVYRIVQYGFISGAEGLGMATPLVSGLNTSGTSQELLNKWDEDIYANGIQGVMLWTNDAAGYDFMRDWHAQGLKIVAPHYRHDYATTHEFIDANITVDAASQGAMAVHLMKELLVDGKKITSGSIGITVSAAQPQLSEALIEGFRNEMAGLGLNFVLLEPGLEGVDINQPEASVEEYIRANPDMVAVFGTTAGSVTNWSAARKNTERDDIIVVGMEFTGKNLDALNAGAAGALIVTPLYEEGEKSAQVLNQLLGGTAMDKEDDWWIRVSGYAVQVSGEGVNGPAYYQDIIERTNAYFANK